MKLRFYPFLVLSFVFIIANLVLSCERDDICAEGTPTTPFLIIKFIDFTSATEIKRPVELQVRAVGVDSIFNIGSVTDSILIPLRTNASITDYELTINSDTSNDTNPSNTDIVSFQYTPVEEYVSSACGFKINYEGLTTSPVEAGSDGSWIQNITVQRQDVIDETAAHVFIFH